jgi:tricorn protease
MISAYGFPVIDGGSVRAPDDAMADPDTGDWIIENYGTPPDITVEFDPFIWRQGKDAQLEAGIKQILEDLKSYKPKPVVRPPYPNWSKVKTGGR